MNDFLSFCLCFHLQEELVALTHSAQVFNPSIQNEYIEDITGCNHQGYVWGLYGFRLEDAVAEMRGEFDLTEEMTCAQTDVEHLMLTWRGIDRSRSGYREV